MKPTDEWTYICLDCDHKWVVGMVYDKSCNGWDCVTGNDHDQCPKCDSENIELQ